MAGFAQTDIALGGLNADHHAAPVEVHGRQPDGGSRTERQAVFAGNVVIGQGEMRMAAGRVEVFYDEASGDIARLHAEGQVTFVTAT